MKKNLYFLMAVATMASVSCINEENGMDQTPSEAVTITATAENDADSKTSLSSGKVLWHNADAVTVWNGKEAGEFTTADPDGSETVSFVASSLEYEGADEYLALYPHSESATFAEGKVTTQVKAVQEAYADGFAKGVNVAVAAGNDENLLFRNVCGYVKFTVPAGMTDLTKVEFEANGEEILAGNVNVTIADEPVAEVVSDGVSTVSLEGTFEAGKSYYIAVLPKTLESGFTMTLTRGEKTTEMSTTKPFTVTRSKAKPVGDLYDGTWQIRLEGTAVPEGLAAMTAYKNGVYSYRGQLLAGNLSLRVLYENLAVILSNGNFTTQPVADGISEVNITSDGYYHIILDTVRNTYKIYTQDVYVDLGARGETAAPWNNVKSATASTHTLKDSENNTTDVILTVGDGFKLYDSATSVDQRGNYYFGDDEMRMTLWYDGLYVAGTKNAGDVGPKTLTLSGLDPNSTYDIRLVSVRFNGSKTARQTKFQLLGSQNSESLYIYQGMKISSSGTGVYPSYEAVPFEEYVTEFDSIAPKNTGDIDIQVTAIDTGTACDGHINAIQIFKNL